MYLWLEEGRLCSWGCRPGSIFCWGHWEWYSVPYNEDSWTQGWAPFIMQTVVEISASLITSSHLTSQHRASNETRKVIGNYLSPFVGNKPWISKPSSEQVILIRKYVCLPLMLLSLKTCPVPYYFHVNPGFYFHKPLCRWMKRRPLTCSFTDFTANIPVNPGWLYSKDRTHTHTPIYKCAVG